MKICATTFLLQNILLQEKKPDSGNGIEHSAQIFCAECSTRWLSTQFAFDPSGHLPLFREEAQSCAPLPADCASQDHIRTPREFCSPGGRVGEKIIGPTLQNLAGSVSHQSFFSRKENDAQTNDRFSDKTIKRSQQRAISAPFEPHPAPFSLARDCHHLCRTPGRGDHCCLDAAAAPHATERTHRSAGSYANHCVGYPHAWIDPAVYLYGTRQWQNRQVWDHDAFFS